MLEAGVLRRVLMPVNAVSLGIVSSLPVLLKGDGFKMLRVDAARVPAQVIDFVPVRDRSNELRVGPAMGYDFLPIDVELTVSGCLLSSDPVPAAVFPSLNLVPKSL